MERGQVALFFIQSIINFVLDVVVLITLHIFEHHLKPIRMKQDNKIVAWGVYYVPNRQGKMFAGLKCELECAFNNQLSAIDICDSMNQGGCLDELHIGYRVYPMQWLPKGVKVN